MKKFLLPFPFHTLTFTTLLAVHGCISIMSLVLFSSGWSFLFILFFASASFFIIVGGVAIASIIFLIKKKFFVRVPISLIVLLLVLQILALFSLPSDGGDTGGAQLGPLGIIAAPLLVGFVAAYCALIYLSLKNAISSLDVTPQEMKKAFLGTVSVFAWIGMCLISSQALYIVFLAKNISFPTIAIPYSVMPGLAIMASSSYGATLIGSLVLSIFIASIITALIALVFNICWSIAKNAKKTYWILFGILLVIMVAAEFMLSLKSYDVAYKYVIGKAAACSENAVTYGEFKKCFDGYKNFSKSPEKRADEIISYCDQFSDAVPEFAETKDMDYIRCTGYTKRDLCKLIIITELYQYGDYKPDETDSTRVDLLLFSNHLKVCKNLGGDVKGTCRVSKEDLCLYYLSNSSYVAYSMLPDNDNHCSYISDAQLKIRCLTERCQGLYKRNPDQIENCVKKINGD